MISRWRPLLSQFSFKIVHTPGKINSMADFLSRKPDHLLPHREVLTTESPVNKTSDNIVSHLIKTVHSNGHLSQERTLNHLKTLGFSAPNLKDWVNDIVSNCGTCQKASNIPRKTPAHTGSLGSSMPFESLHLDCITLPKDAKGFKHVLVIVDGFSKFTFLTPLKNLSAEATCDILTSKVFSIFGLPLQVHSDGGKEFANNLESNRPFSFPNHSPSNGLVERVNQEVVKLTRKLSTDTANHTDWSDKIPLIQLILNSEPSSTTKLSPYSLLFGRHIKPRRNLLDVLLSRNDTTDKTSNTHSFVDQISKETLKLTSEAISRKRKTVDATPNEFLVGDLVLLDDAPNKLLNLLGPFQVTKKHGNSGYEIESIVADKKRTVSAYDLHSFSPNILDENAKRLAASDYDEHLVNQVIDHDPKNEWFLVRFSNGVEAWQPLDNLRDGSKINCYLQDYCLKHKLNLTPRKRGRKGKKQC
ncbi:hypothetical protein GEMRC1_013039 [Eukaryota sp. GEM-RC1]